jgi:V8-like Glu-specific endopeptidase
MRRRSSLALLAALVLLVVPAIAAPAGAAGHGRSERDRILAFWTPARMQAAIPRDFVKTAHGFVPAAKPPPPGGGGVTGASWTKEGAILHASGKVYFVMGNSAYVCSGSVVNDSRSTRSLVLTAGHCTYDETNGQPATNWIFVPEYDSGPNLGGCSNGGTGTKWGCWTAVGLVADTGFADSGSFDHDATVHDFAFAIVAGGGFNGSTQLDATVGSFPIAYSGVSAGNTLYAFGYPAAGKYHGNDLVYCAGAIITDSLNDDDTWGMPCGMTGGSSGGPWLSGFNEGSGSGTLSSLNSYGYSGIKNMYGPKFNSDTQAVFNAANGGNGNVVVGR